MEKLLAKLGLSKIEIIIYQTLLESGHLSISALAEKTGLYRPQIYKYLPQLINANLVSESRLGQRKVYVAESPRQLEKLADNVRTEIQDSLPDLLALYSTSKRKPLVRYLEGTRGIKKVYQDVIDTCQKNDVYYRYESPKKSGYMHKYITDEYRTRFRDRAEVERLIITNEMTGKQKKQRLGRLVKVVPAKYDLFSYDITELIYGTKVAFIDFGSETAIIIDNPVFAEFQKKLFKLLFEKLNYT